MNLVRICQRWLNRSIKRRGARPQGYEGIQAALIERCLKRESSLATPSSDLRLGS